MLAIYEVGQCFFQGWGVAKDQKMAVVCGWSLSDIEANETGCRATTGLLQNWGMQMLSRI